MPGGFSTDYRSGVGAILRRIAMTLDQLSQKIDEHFRKIDEQTKKIKSIDKKIKWTPVSNEGVGGLIPLDMYGFENWRND